MATRTLYGVGVENVSVNGVSCERLTPVHFEKSRVIVYVDGGGYCIGAPSMGYGLCSYLASALDAQVIAVNYRLAPEHPAPAALEDLEAVLSSFFGRALVVLGDSAGAGVLCAALQRSDYDVRAATLLSPWLDLSVDRSLNAELVERDPLLSPEWLSACAEAYAGEDLMNPTVSPIFGDWSRFPPTLVIGGSDDILSPDVRRLDALELAQVSIREFPDFWHDFALSVGQLDIASETARLIATHFATATGWHAKNP